MKTHEFCLISSLFVVPVDFLMRFNDSGWMDIDSFCCNLEEIAKWAKLKKIPFPIAYIVDKHSSHIAEKSIETARNLQIELVLLHPNSTHIIQIADKCMFRSIKAAWNRQMFEWRRKNPNTNFKIENFAPMLKSANDDSIRGKPLTQVTK